MSQAREISLTSPETLPSEQAGTVVYVDGNGIVTNNNSINNDQETDSIG